LPINSSRDGELFQDHIWPIVSTDAGLTEDTKAALTASSVVDERDE